MNSLARPILKELEAGRPFALAVILSHRGSTPRTSGSRMLVRRDRTIAGTIGGGLVEARVMEACAGMLDLRRSAVMDFTLDQELTSGMDMVCGGSLTVWLCSFVSPFSQGLRSVFATISELMAAGKEGLVVTRITGGIPGDPSLVDPHDPSSAALLPKALVADIEAGKFSGPGPVRQVYGLEDYLVDRLVPGETLYIFGAGHVGLQLGKMAHLAGFSTVVIDDRSEFASRERFPHARKVLVVDAFESAFEELTVGDKSYIVILTRGHLHDQDVLEQALESDAAYIGMIGSRRKRDRIYANLMAKGVPAERLAAVHSPIGTDILAETPAEIAVSILGELIRERAIKRGTGKAARKPGTS